MKSTRGFFVVLLALILVAGEAVAQGPRHVKVRAGSVRKVVTVVNPKNWGGPAPAHLTFTGTIFVNKPPVEVEYKWIRSDGGQNAPQRVTISSAGQGFTDTWDVGAPGQKMRVWEKLQVLSPNRKVSNAAVAIVHCR